MCIKAKGLGVPITLCTCIECGELVETKKVFERAVEGIKRQGAEFWFETPIEDLISKGTKCEKCGGEEFKKENDILDVWFDSGVSHAAVLENNTSENWPADLYLEGSDQHR